MYKCEECGGFIEELGEMALSDGGCICAQKKAEESANNLQQLRAEIASFAETLDISNEGHFCKSYIVAKLRQLSAV